MGAFSQTSSTSLSHEKDSAITCLATTDRLTDDRKQSVAAPNRYESGLPPRAACSSPCAFVGASLEPTVESDYRLLCEGGGDD